MERPATANTGAKAGLAAAHHPAGATPHSQETSRDTYITVVGTPVLPYSRNPPVQLLYLHSITVLLFPSRGIPFSFD